MRPNLTEHVFQKKMGEKWREKKFRENPPSTGQGWRQL